LSDIESHRIRERLDKLEQVTKELFEGIDNIGKNFKLIRKEMKKLDEDLTKFTEIERLNIENLKDIKEMLENADA